LASGGAILVAADGTTSALAPAGTARALASRPAGTAAATLALEDGTVWSVGGSSGARVQTFSPMSGRWSMATLAGDVLPTAWQRAGAARLADGTVLMVGGADADGPVAGVWRLRPSLIGPWAGQVTVTPAGADGPPALVPLDVGAVDRTGAWALETPGAWAVIGGITPAAATLRATVTVDGGLAILLGGAVGGDGLVVRLANAMAASAGTCVGDAVAWDGGAHAVEVHRGPGQLRVLVDDVQVLNCDPGTPPVAGGWGVAPLGASARVEIATVTLERTP